MLHYTFEADFRYTPLDDDVAPIGEFMNGVTDHLLDLGAEDLHVVLDKQDTLVTIALLMSANAGESTETTIGKALGTMRTAFHHCGAHTPAWPMPRDLILAGVTLRQAPVADDIADRQDAGELANA